jgi:signal transduction histidine kinase
MIRPRRLRARLVAAFGFTALGLAAVALAGVLAFIALTHALDEHTNRYSPARIEAAELLSALVDQETGVRGYALSGNARLLAPDTSGRSAETARRGDLRQLVGGDGRVAAALAQLDSAAAQWRTGWADPVTEEVRAHGTHGVTVATVDRGKTQFDNVRTAAGRLDQVLADRQRQTRARLRITLDVLLGLGVACVAGLVALCALMWRWLNRLVIRPLERLAAAVAAPGGEQLDQVRTSGDPPPEIAAVATAMVAARDRVAAERDSAVRARERSQRQAARLAEQAATLERQADELRRSNDELRQFADVASHDLREPLRTISTSCQRLEHSHGDQLDQGARECIDIALAGTVRMRELIDDLLDYAKVGHSTRPFRPVDLAEAFGSTIRAMQATIDESGAQVEASGLPTVLGERSQFIQLLQNLLANSIMFRTPGETPRVRVDAVRLGDEWMFSCTDNGIGIAPRYADRIFGIFQRLHADEDYAGTGIGLSLCRKIVERHGGRIWLDTHGSPGAVIRWTLPALPAAALVPATGSATGSAAGSRTGSAAGEPSDVPDQWPGAPHGAATQAGATRAGGTQAGGEGGPGSADQPARGAIDATTQRANDRRISR